MYTDVPGRGMSVVYRLRDQRCSDKACAHAQSRYLFAAGSLGEWKYM